eukprot:IDg5715t1
MNETKKALQFVNRVVLTETFKTPTYLKTPASHPSNTAIYALHFIHWCSQCCINHNTKSEEDAITRTSKDVKKSYFTWENADAQVARVHELRTEKGKDKLRCCQRWACIRVIPDDEVRRAVADELSRAMLGISILH